MWEKYRDRSGYVHIPGWKLLTIKVDCVALKPDNLSRNRDLEIRNWDEIDWSALCNYDYQYTEGRRHEAYLRAILTQPRSLTKVNLSLPSAP